VGSKQTKAADFRALLKLWDNARSEYEAANHLLLVDGQGLDRSTALHLQRGWHALATIHARQSGLPDPDFESFEINRDSELLETIPLSQRASLVESFTIIREAALAELSSDEPPGVELETLRLQLRLLGRCIAARRQGVVVSSWSWRVLFRARLLLTAAAAVILVLVAVGLASRLDRDSDEALSGDFEEITEPEIVRVDVNRLRDFKPRGYPWDGSGNVKFRNRLIVTLGERKHPEVMSIALDGNDRYSLALMEGDVRVGLLELGPSASHGLEVYTVTVPSEAAARGFNSIVIQVLEGDGSHSIGHLLLERPGEDTTQRNVRLG
jgi:hypothetical protein